MRVALEAGGPGQFDVLVNGEVVAGKDRSLLKALFGGGWPREADVIAAVAARLPGDEAARGA